MGKKAKGISMQIVLSPVPLLQEALRVVPSSVPPFLVSSPGLKATLKVFRSDILVLPASSPDAAGRCLTWAGFGNGLGCSAESTATEGKPQAEEQSIVLARL